MVKRLHGIFIQNVYATIDTHKLQITIAVAYIISTPSENYQIFNQSSFYRYFYNVTYVIQNRIFKTLHVLRDQECYIVTIQSEHTFKKMSDGIPDNAGVVVFNEQDGAVGFGVMTKAGVDAARSQFGARVVIHQADVGEYLRDQEQMF
ncbi:Ribosome_subunit biogenesis protein NIP7 [Hexamita inflata]|uniref:Ribosome subunit biogenesis protein NIP7 n=1 Tax=Hexamita inflata TaxID=28002 RepID=A0AA86QXK1_9EUKA|nr:Ribosome subunit biogenesis protein NIP7 [Hexamita inflata]